MTGSLHKPTAIGGGSVPLRGRALVAGGVCHAARGPVHPQLFYRPNDELKSVEWLGLFRDES